MSLARPSAPPAPDSKRSKPISAHENINEERIQFVKHLQQKIQQTRDEIAVLEETKLELSKQTPRENSTVEPQPADSKTSHQSTAEIDITLREKRSLVTALQETLEKSQKDFISILQFSAKAQKQLDIERRKATTTEVKHTIDTSSELVNTRNNNAELVAEVQTLRSHIEITQRSATKKTHWGWYILIGAVFCLGLAFTASGLGAVIGIPLVAAIFGIGPGIATILAGLVDIGIVIAGLIIALKTEFNANSVMIAANKMITPTPKPNASNKKANQLGSTAGQMQPLLGPKISATSSSTDLEIKSAASSSTTTSFEVKPQPIVPSAPSPDATADINARAPRTTAR